MPWELLSRFHRPVRRQPTPQPPLQDTVPQVQQAPSVLQLPIDRKILQDPNSFLEAEAQDVVPRALTPSTHLPSADRSGHPSFHSRLIDPPSEGSKLPSGSSMEPSPRVRSRLTISRISRIAAGGEWSTFGRKREHRVTDVADGPPLDDDPQRSPHSPSFTQDNKQLSVDSIPSTFTLSRVTHTSLAMHERQSSPGSRSRPHSPDVRCSSKCSSPAETMSSKRHPRTPQGPSSCTTPQTTTSAMNSTTPAGRAAGLDSPHTFGHPTPPDNLVVYPSPPPPLPPLDHPELAAALSSRRQSASTGQPAMAVFRDRSNTLPTDRRAPRKDDLFASLSHRLGGRRSSLARAKQDLGPAMAEEPARRLRARSVSGGARRRRTSADWSAYQAGVGVTAQGNQAWPAEVSREILRLSLGTPGSSGVRKLRTRGDSVDPVHKPHRGVLSPSLLPFPRPNTPPPAASATLQDGREAIPSRSHSLKFDLGTSRGSRLSARSTMTEVKRSVSAIESRSGRNNEAGGATYPSLGLSDPEAPQPSLHPSLALAPSPSLRSSRVSPADTPMVSSSQGEPSTPTPAPRHLSDKSRGKRKAEDNIDLTPPEQKKEGQRATFLLPTEPRSQRISNSSHAPSSYHRKRARLSSTSPFTTPVQSRAPSVQETPQSANRNHHFTSLSSGTSARVAPPRTPSRAASTLSRQPPTPSTTRKHERHQSMSQVSIPISAIVSPHAPSVSRSTKFHMRDPRKPPKKPNDTPWSLRLATEDEPGSPIQAWSFFFGFLFFPIWWIAGLLLRVPKTRVAGDVAAEKGVAIDDPQIEHDARVWRIRCRVMAVVSLFTYVPFIVLIAIFAPR